MVDNMRNAESCVVSGRMHCHTRCKGRRPMVTVLRNPILDVHIRQVVAVGKLCIITLLKLPVSHTPKCASQ